MPKCITPEEAGIPSAAVEQFVRALERHGLVMHSLLLGKGDDLFCEGYWAPFGPSFCHRMYSQTKSYVGIAILLLAAEGKLGLDDPIVPYFAEKADAPLPPALQAQTVRNMLTMETACRSPYWFETSDPDRTHEYFNASQICRPPGSMWEYDSPGSQVLAALVEKLSGRPLLAYLREKIFSHLGTFQTAEMLQTPSGDTWGDSALLCTTRDMFSFARLLANGGRHNGVSLIPPEAVAAATAAQVSNHTNGFSDHRAQGYGYQIWHTRGGGFAFFGMGGQYTIYRPAQDITLVCTGDNQGFEGAVPILFALFEELIIERAGAPLPPAPATQASPPAASPWRTAPPKAPPPPASAGSSSAVRKTPAASSSFPSVSRGIRGSSLMRTRKAKRSCPSALGITNLGNFRNTGIRTA